ncbi:MAG: ABC transporter permease subunit [Dehalococcoidales bacterium]|nr:ABC transporter permease subunit [Dehalococcoidales bacterium]
MRNIMLIASKELRSYLTSPMAYIVVCIFLLLSGLFFVLYLTNTSFNDTSLKGFIDPLSVFGVQTGGNVLILLFAVVLTMRTLAEEKKLGTWELLLTSPVRDSDVVLGKFLGSMGILITMLVLTLFYPLLLVIFGDPDMGPIWTSYLGLFLLGSTALSVGIFASSLTSNQIVAAVVSGAILFGLWVIGIIASSAPQALQQVLSYISLSYHSAGFEVGIIDTRDIVYYLSITALFLYFSTRSIEASRWG